MESLVTTLASISNLATLKDQMHQKTRSLFNSEATRSFSQAKSNKDSFLRDTSKRNSDIYWSDTSGDLSNTHITMSKSGAHSVQADRETEDV